MVSIRFFITSYIFIWIFISCQEIVLKTMSRNCISCQENVKKLYFHLNIHYFMSSNNHLIYLDLLKHDGIFWNTSPNHLLLTSSEIYIVCVNQYFGSIPLWFEVVKFSFYLFNTCSSFSPIGSLTHPLIIESAWHMYWLVAASLTAVFKCSER